MSNPMLFIVDPKNVVYRRYSQKYDRDSVEICIHVREYLAPGITYPEGKIVEFEVFPRTQMYGGDDLVVTLFKNPTKSKKKKWGF
jgi:hypothetical protein